MSRSRNPVAAVVLPLPDGPAMSRRRPEGAIFSSVPWRRVPSRSAWRAPTRARRPRVRPPGPHAPPAPAQGGRAALPQPLGELPGGRLRQPDLLAGLGAVEQGAVLGNPQIEQVEPVEHRLQIFQLAPGD